VHVNCLFNLINFIKPIDKQGLALYNICYTKEKEMEKETTAPKAPRITKKALIATLMAKGVDAKIVKSLERSNIETIKFVSDLV